jgi:hypothetical protein
MLPKALNTGANDFIAANSSRNTQLSNISYRERISLVFGIGGGNAKGYKSNKAIYKIIEHEFEKEGKQPLAKNIWNLKFFGDDSTQFREDLDQAIANFYILSQLDIRPREPIHHNLSLSFYGIESFIRELPILKKKIDKVTDFKNYMLKLIVWYLLPVAYPINKALLYQSETKSIETEKKRKVKFSLSDSRIENLLEIYRKKVGVECEYEKVENGSYKIKFGFGEKLFERYDYLNLENNPSIDELFEKEKKLIDSLKRNFVIMYYLSSNMLSLEEIAHKYEEILYDLKKDLPDMMTKFKEMKADMQNILNTAEELGSVELLLKQNPTSDSITTCELKISSTTREKLDSLAHISSCMETFWHILQPGELLPLLEAYGREYIEKIW